jgi:hypothetical protein
MPIAKRVVLSVVSLLGLAVALSGCGSRTHGIATVHRPVDARPVRTLNFPDLTDAQFEAMWLVAADWHHTTRERRRVREGHQWNYVCLFHTDITFKHGSLHSEPIISWIWGVRDPRASCVRIGFDSADQPIVVEEVERAGLQSLRFDEVCLNYRKAIETAELQLGDPDITLFRLGWSGEGAYQWNEVLYPSSADCICWEVRTRDGKVFRFDAMTFRTITD